MPFPCIILLLLLLPPVTAQDPDNFIKKHIIERMEGEDCDKNMRQINSNTGECKDPNTFILATVEKVNQLCQEIKNDEKTGKIKSRTTFKIVVCKDPQGAYPDCDYPYGSKMDRLIIIVCEQGKPVHYVGAVKPHKKTNV